MESTDIQDIVSRILGSPQLRNSLENTVRALATPSALVISNNANTSESSIVGNNIGSLSSPSPLPNLIPNPRPQIRQELNRLFPSISSSSRGNRRSRTSASLAPPKLNSYNKDVILLKSPNSFTTLKGFAKAAAYEAGFAVSDVKFESSWSYNQICTHIRGLFYQLENINFDIVVPIGGRLTKPNLTDGTELNGSTLKRIFSQKIIYIRPNQNIVSDEENSPNEFEISVCNNDPNLESTVNTRIEHNNAASNAESFIEESILADAESFLKGEILEISLSLEDILRNLQIGLKDEISYFNIYREDIFNCCIRAMRRKKFDPFNKISVKFSDIEGISEGAVDAGGPTREMFRLVLMNIKNSRLFIGGEKKFLTLDRESLEKREYFEAGRLISLSLVHGGPGPHFFSDCFYKVLTEGLDNGVPCMEFIERDIVEKFEIVKQINDLDKLKEFILEEPVFAIAGCYNIRSLEEKEKIIEDMTKFYNFHRVRPSYEQFIEGLKTCNIYDLMVENSVVFKEVMCQDRLKLNATLLENVFQINYSEVGSSKRNIENRLVGFWRDYLLDCEDNESQSSLEDIIIFATGAEGIPPLGFPWKPKLLFLHESDSPYPKANTCGLELHLPTIHKTYEEFKTYIDFGIGNCQDFAFA